MILARGLDPKLFPSEEKDSQDLGRALKDPEMEKLNQEMRALLHEKGDSLQKRIEAEKFRSLENQKEEFHKWVSKLHQIDRRIRQLENPLPQKVEKLQSLYMEMEQKIREQKKREVQVQSMIDRHNSLIMDFQAKMQKMHRLIEEKEMQNASLRNTISDLKRDIERLKKL